MEKLDKVIAGLEQCENNNLGCVGCPYYEIGPCKDYLEGDALAVIKDLRTDNQRLREMWAEATKNLSMAIAERDEARKEAMKLEAELFELRQTPNDWGEYPPEFPREGM